MADVREMVRIALSQVRDHVHQTDREDVFCAGVIAETLAAVDDALVERREPKARQ